MDLFAVDDAETADKDYWSLIGVGGSNVEAMRKVARLWLDLGPKKLHDPGQVGSLPQPNAKD